MISAGPVSPTCSWHIRSAFGVSRVLFPMTADEQGSLDLGLTANSVCRGSDTSVNDYITCKNAGRAQRQPVNVCFYTLNVNPFIANSGANWPNRHLFAQHAVVMPQPVTCCYITVNVQGSGPFHVYTVVYQQWTEQSVAANGNVSACRKLQLPARLKKIILLLWRCSCPERLFTVSGRKSQYSQCKTFRKAGRPSRCIVTSSVSHWLHLCQSQTQVETALLYSPTPLFILCCWCPCSQLSVCVCANHTESTVSQILSVYTHTRLINLILILSHWFCLRPSQTQVQ